MCASSSHSTVTAYLSRLVPGLGVQLARHPVLSGAPGWRPKASLACRDSGLTALKLPVWRRRTVYCIAVMLVAWGRLQAKGQGRANGGRAAGRDSSHQGAPPGLLWTCDLHLPAACEPSSSQQTTASLRPRECGFAGPCSCPRRCSCSDVGRCRTAAAPGRVDGCLTAWMTLHAGSAQAGWQLGAVPTF